jgi:alcohol dehydrogenase class IV
MSFEFAAANRILFGSGRLAEVPALARAFGSSALVVAGRSGSRVQPLLDGLQQHGIATTVLAVHGEPTTRAVIEGAAAARTAHCDLVIGFGGGSPIDAAKAIAALLANPGDLYEYLEVIGRGGTLAHPSAPCIAIPTTAGTGAEVTRNAVLAAPEHRVKVSLRSPLMLPRYAVVDPELTRELPPEVTAATGLDALTQLIEPFVSNRANPMTDALCREGLDRVARSLRVAHEHASLPQGDSRRSTTRFLAAREDMMLASLFSGLALANAGLGAVHGFAAPIGGTFAAPHGAICATLLPHVMQLNLAAAGQRGGAEVVSRYTEIAQRLTGRSNASASEGVEWVRNLCHDLHIPRLAHYGIRDVDFPTIIEQAARASSMKANPVPLTPGEMSEVLARAL